jgi:hypothetical protein
LFSLGLGHLGSPRRFPELNPSKQRLIKGL